MKSQRAPEMLTTDPCTHEAALPRRGESAYDRRLFPGKPDANDDPHSLKHRNWVGESSARQDCNRTDWEKMEIYSLQVVKPGFAAPGLGRFWISFEEVD